MAAKASIEQFDQGDFAEYQDRLHFFLFLSNVVEIHTKYGSPRSGGPDAINVVVVCRCVCLSVTFFVSQTGSVSSLLLLDNVALGPGGVQARVLLAIRERERRPRRHFPLIRKFKLFA